MVIRSLGVEELDKVLHLAAPFYASSGVLKNFKPDAFKRTWDIFLKGGTGKIFILEDETGVHGALGGAVVPDMNSGDLIAAELFWFVAEDKRGRGVGLLRAYEKWAIEMGCRRIAMCYLCDLMPEKVGRIYELLGYKKAEVAYMKEA